MKIIPLVNNRGEAYVDDEDYERVSAYKWHVLADIKRPNNFYARTTIRVGGIQKTLLLHRFILNATPNQQIDHRDNIGLNCVRSNLRIATHAQNQQNGGPRRGRLLKGTYRVSGSCKWYARVYCDKAKHYLGAFDTEEAAARAYDEKAKELHGEFAKLNFF